MSAEAIIGVVVALSMLACGGVIVLGWISGLAKRRKAYEDYAPPPLVLIPDENPAHWPARQDTTRAPVPTGPPPRRRPTSRAYDAGAWLEATTDIVPHTGDPFGDELAADWYLRNSIHTPAGLALMAEYQRGRERRINGVEPL